MPIYEYQCEACGERTETIQPRSAPPLDKCPKCGGKVRKLLSAPSFQFKGSGWYATDYGAKKESKDAKGAETSGGAESPDASSATKVTAGDGAASKSKESATSETKKTSGAAAQPAKPAPSSS